MLWSLERVQQGAGVWADVVVFMDGLVQVHRLSVNMDLHTAAVGCWHQCGHQRNIWEEKWKRHSDYFSSRIDSSGVSSVTTTMQNSMIQHVESVGLSGKKQNIFDNRHGISHQAFGGSLMKKINSLLCFLAGLGTVWDPTWLTQLAVTAEVTTMSHTSPDNKVSHS